jgi:hypothetical protein
MSILNTPYTAYFDGACELINPGGTASYGAVILRGGEPIWMSSEISLPIIGGSEQTLAGLAMGACASGQYRPANPHRFKAQPPG